MSLKHSAFQTCHRDNSVQVFISRNNPVNLVALVVDWNKNRHLALYCPTLKPLFYTMYKKTRKVWLVECVSYSRGCLQSCGFPRTKDTSTVQILSLTETTVNNAFRNFKSYVDV